MRKSVKESNRAFVDTLITMGKLNRLYCSVWLGELIDSEIAINKFHTIGMKLFARYNDMLLFLYNFSRLYTKEDYEIFLKELKKILKIYMEYCEGDEVMLLDVGLNLEETLNNILDADIHRYILMLKIYFGPLYVKLDNRKYKSSFIKRNKLNVMDLTYGSNIVKNVGVIIYKEDGVIVKKFHHLEDYKIGWKAIKENLKTCKLVIFSARPFGVRNFENHIEYLLNDDEYIKITSQGM